MKSIRSAAAVIAALVIFCVGVLSVNAADSDNTSPALSRDTIILYSGQSYRLTLRNDTEEAVTFLSDNTNVATVNNDGLIFANDPGTSLIKCRLSDKKELKCTVTVREGNGPESISMDHRTVTVRVGEKVRVKAVVLPENAEGGVTYSSSDKTIASVEKSGEIKGIRPGIAVVRAETSSSAVATGCIVRVVGNDGAKLDPEVTGMLLDENGDPLANKQISLSGNNKEYKAVTENDGKFSLGKVSLGSYVLETGTESNRKYSENVLITAGSNRLTCILTDGGLAVLYAGAAASEKSISDIRLSQGSIRLVKGDDYYIGCNVLPATTEEKPVFSSSDSRIASVDEYGKITAIREGTATITVASPDGRIKKKCIVSVSQDGIGYFGWTVILLQTTAILLIITAIVYHRKKKTGEEK